MEHFLLSSDVSKARKTSESIELIFLKVLAKRWKGYMPFKFLLKCKHLEEFSGVSADGTFKAIINVL